MLYKTTFSPQAFNLEETTYSSLIGLLKELEKNCVILVDSTKKLEKKLTDTVENLPEKYRKSAMMYYKSLKRKGRIIRQDFCDSSAIEENLCEFHRSAMAQTSNLSMFTSENCCLRSDALLNSRLISLEDYSLSNLFGNRKDNYAFPPAGISRNDMEETILIPLFETAKSIRLIDRYIGRSMIDSHGNIKPQLSKNYKNTLKWLFSIFDQYPSQPKKRLEIYTGVNPQRCLSHEQIMKLHNNLMNSFYQIREKFTSFEFDLIIKRETSRSAMPHARYLFTNQLSLSIDRGFDLLFYDKPNMPIIRDVTICLISEPENIEQSIRILPDLIG
ncbi:MAG: hypothetical protein MH252_05905 [Thermosynechococcaceae cyanobacterium MS004]|nr:hypothetical protein [Thermosynechococcaceae cyanobacterium MS004]